jgi:hypothetical protein
MAMHIRGVCPAQHLLQAVPDELTAVTPLLSAVMQANTYLAMSLQVY